MLISMTESGNPKDNAEVERINNTLKNELLKDMIFTDINQVKEVIQKAIMFYNYERPHMSLEMRTPVEVATETGRFKRRWISYRERAIDSMNENLRIIKKATNDAGWKIFCNFALNPGLRCLRATPSVNFAQG